MKTQKKAGARTQPSSESTILIEAKIQTESVRQKSLLFDCYLNGKSMWLYSLIRLKQSIEEDYRFDKEMGFPADEQKYATRLGELRKKIDAMYGGYSTDADDVKQLADNLKANDRLYNDSKSISELT